MGKGVKAEATQARLKPSQREVSGKQYENYLKKIYIEEKHGNVTFLKTEFEIGRRKKKRKNKKQAQSQ